MSEGKERILVTVKTYPQLSATYGETVCTAGIRPDGSWVRIYPVPFRRLDEPEQYRKFDWVELDLRRNQKDPRPETFRAANEEDFVAVGHVDTARQWEERRRLILKTCRVYSTLQVLIDEAKSKSIATSLAVFKPTKILGFVVEDDEREWNPDRLKAMREKYRQVDLFSDQSWRETFKLVDKLPYKFSYKFEDDTGRQSTLQILDWEIGALYWNCLRRAGGDEQEAIAKVRVKYVDEFLNTDLHFFLGTTQQWHFRALNPWLIIGVFPIPYETQPTLF